MSDNPGIVYLVSAYHDIPCGYFKIGITRQYRYQNRINAIESNSPFKIRPICVVRHSKPEQLETDFSQGI